MNQIELATPQLGGFNAYGGGGHSGTLLTLKQLLYRLEAHFPTLLSGEGSLRSEGESWSDRLLSSYDDTYMETLGPPGAVTGLFYSYCPEPTAEGRKKRIWAGTLLRNALPRWRGGKTWVRRALQQLEADPELPAFKKEIEGHSVEAAYAQSGDAGRLRLLVRIMPLVPEKPRPLSLGISRLELLNGLRGIFSEQDAPWPEEPFHLPNAEFRPDNDFASLLVFGEPEEVIQIDYVYRLCEARRAEHDKNRTYALELIRNIFPGWPEAAEWLRNAIVVTELERSPQDKKVLRYGLALQVRYHQERIAISVMPEGALP